MIYPVKQTKLDRMVEDIKALGLDKSAEAIGTIKDFWPVELFSSAPELALEVQRLRKALIAVQQSLIWDEKDRAMDGDPITLEALVAQVEQVRSDITEMIE